MTTPPKFRLGDRVAKVSGSSWHGVIVGTYSTALTPEGYAVESEREPGSVQIYPAAALARADDDDEARLLREADEMQARIDATIRSLDETRDARRALAAMMGSNSPEPCQDGDTDRPRTIERLREALRPFAIEADQWDAAVPDAAAVHISDGAESEECDIAYFRVGDLRRARAILDETTDA